TQPDRRRQQGGRAGGGAGLSRAHVRDVPRLGDAGADDGAAAARLRGQPRRLDDQRHARPVRRSDRARAHAGSGRHRPHHLQPAARRGRPRRVPPDDRRRDRAPGGGARRLSMLRPFALHRPASAEEACDLLSRLGEDAVPYAGGTLAFADPHSDLATLFLALDARVQLASPRGRRELSLDDFVRGPWETARAADELLTSVTLTPWPGRTAAAYVKFGVHERPTLGVAVALRLEPAANGAASVAEARLAIGCVDPRPARVPAAE